MTKIITLRTCIKGHIYYKSSDCPTCPICENQNKPVGVFLEKLSAPARRALQNEGIDSLEILATYTLKQILSLHGLGKSSIPTLVKALEVAKLNFKPSD